MAIHGWRLARNLGGSAGMSKQTDRRPYGGRDLRAIPAYTIIDAARYLRMPERTIRN
jgi:hypothetical protein